MVSPSPVLSHTIIVQLSKEENPDPIKELKVACFNKSFLQWNKRAKKACQERGNHIKISNIPYL
jgi:hypothetical protein